MIRPALSGLLCLLAIAAARSASAADMSIDLVLDPAAGHASVRTVIASPAESFRLARTLAASGVTIAGRAAQPDASGRYAVGPDGPAEIAYSFALPGLDGAREIGFIEPRGTLLLGDWLPDWGADSFTYELRIELPDSQRAVSSGVLVEESTAGGRAVVRYRYDKPARDIAVAAGPLAVGETLRDGRRLRTYFPADLAALGARYRDRAGDYLARYSSLIGPYPHDGFSVVAGPAPLGVAFPTFTLLSRQILPLPFVLDRSLGHEVLHGWWGNGVEVDYDSGNWCEALTVFMADYAFAEEAGEETAREMRRRWLADFSGLPASQDMPVTAFRSKGHAATQIVGYNKGAMLFLMLQDRIGKPAFERAIRQFWQDWQFRRASWSDLRSSFEQASGEALAPFFTQWTERRGAPQLVLEAAERNKDGVTLTLRQESEVYDLRLPVLVETAAGSETRMIQLSQSRAQLVLQSSAEVTHLIIDPDYRVFRRLAPQEIAPTVRRLVTAERAAIVALGAGETLAARAAAAILEKPGSPGALAAAMQQRRPLLVVGTREEVARALAAAGLPPRPAEIPPAGTGHVWAARYGADIPMLVIAAADETALAAMLPAIRHYGAESWLAFDGARLLARGVLPPAGSPLEVRF